MNFMKKNGVGIFAGTAINDTSSVTAAASTWDSMWNLGSETLNKAVTVKLTRTLAIITTICIHMGVNAGVFQPLKELSKFMIIMAMAAIGLNSNVIQLR